MKITIIGAGGYMFPLRLAGDVLSHPALRDSTLSLMDVDAARLRHTAEAVQALVRHHGLPAQVHSTTERRAALEGADVVIVTFQVGGLEAYRHDVEIPRRYGLDQTVGDTLGPGGVMRFLRSSVALRALALDMREACPGALLLNYANPMAMNCWYLSELGVRAAGLCHSVQNTSQMLARQLGVPYEEVSYRAAGINHQAWFLEFRHGPRDLYPRLRAEMPRRHPPGRAAPNLAHDSGDHSDARHAPTVYEGGQEQVRTAIMAAFGYFHTESSHHASEYLPYFRKDPQTTRRYIAERWDYYTLNTRFHEHDRTGELLGQLKERLEPSLEYGAQIVESIVSGRPRVVYANVPNRGLIDNLPPGCCVEVPCLVDSSGVQPTGVGALPPQLAALNRSNVAVQELAVRAALEQDPQHVRHAILLDPLTGALLTLEQIHAMTDELLEAEARWLPEFARRGA